jgi:hypothetical protein
MSGSGANKEKTRPQVMRFMIRAVNIGVRVQAFRVQAQAQANDDGEKFNTIRTQSVRPKCCQSVKIKQCSPCESPSEPVDCCWLCRTKIYHFTPILTDHTTSPADEWSQIIFKSELAISLLTAAPVCSLILEFANLI